MISYTPPDVIVSMLSLLNHLILLMINIHYTKFTKYSLCLKSHKSIFVYFTHILLIIYILSTVKTYSILCCVRKHAGLEEKLLYFNMLDFKYKNTWLKCSFPNSESSFNHQFCGFCYCVKLTKFKLPVAYDSYKYNKT